MENHFGETEEKRKEPFIPLNEGTPYGAGALQKNILALIPASKATISRALEVERNAGMSGISVIRNNAAPFLFRTIPIPSVHDAGWHVRVYEASRTVKKKVPRRLRESTHELWRTAASGYDEWQLINYINLYNTPTSVRPLQRHLIFSPSPRQRNLPEVGKNGNHQERDSAMPGEITPSHSCRYRKSMGSRGPAARATLGQSA